MPDLYNTNRSIMNRTDNQRVVDFWRQSIYLAHLMGDNEFTLSRRDVYMVRCFSPAHHTRNVHVAGCMARRSGSATLHYTLFHGCIFVLVTI